MGLSDGIKAEHFRAIGRIAVEFGELEKLLHSCICWTVGKDGDVAELIADELGTFEKRVNFIGKVFKRKHSGAAWKSKFDDLMKSIKKVQSERNALLHSVWLTNEANLAVIDQMTIKTEGPGARRRYSVQELDGIADEINRINERFWHFIANEFE
jgi:hypothetical protein